MNKTTAMAKQVEARIILARGQRVMLDADLAELYGVETRVLNQAVTRNKDRFPDDFMFRLDREEWDNLRSQSVMSSWGGRRHPPRAFTQEGVAMLSSVLKSKRAAQVNVEIMRAFVRLRHLLAQNEELAMRIDALEARYDDQFAQVFEAIRRLMLPPPDSGRKIGL